ncbi:hypothetical protein ACIRP7_24250 [Streptomyces sp. NPDC102270]|uniref:hypothetical protein n=1 Tax=Streptomyces sp. NPDC102270 TaxID=3366150 RepID=UPI0037FCC580
MSPARPGAVPLGVVLLVMPVVVLASAAGRLGAARREQRLATLRPAGATPRQILAMTAVEAAGIGGAWYTGQLWVGLPWLAAVVAAVTALITVSAVTMLGQVATSPLGVAQQSDPRRTRAIRLVLFVAVLGYICLFGFLWGARQATRGPPYSLIASMSQRAR